MHEAFDGDLSTWAGDFPGTAMLVAGAGAAGTSSYLRLEKDGTLGGDVISWPFDNERVRSVSYWVRPIEPTPDWTPDYRYAGLHIAPTQSPAGVTVEVSPDGVAHVFPADDQTQPMIATERWTIEICIEYGNAEIAVGRQGRTQGPNTATKPSYSPALVAKPPPRSMLPRKLPLAATEPAIELATS